jgi:antitoxin CcdA
MPFQTTVDTRQRTQEELDRDVLAASGDRRAELWRKENAEAIESYNTYVEQHGLPLEKYRMF